MTPVSGTHLQDLDDHWDNLDVLWPRHECGVRVRRDRRDHVCGRGEGS